jgi:hypothetical protein
VVARAILDIAETETGVRPAPPEEWWASFVVRTFERGYREDVEVVYRDDVMVDGVRLENRLCSDPDVTFRNVIIGPARVRGYRSVIFRVW